MLLRSRLPGDTPVNPNSHLLGYCIYGLLCPILLLTTPSTASAVELLAGDILVSTRGKVGEYTPQGVLRNTITVPHPDTSRLSDRTEGGVAIDGSGKIWVANIALSSYQSYLSRFDPASSSWQHFAFPASAQPVGNAFDRDLSISGDRIIYGKNVFDSGDSSWSVLPDSVFPPNRSPAQVSIGQDHLMYGLISGSPRERVRVSDPTTFQVLRDLTLRDGEGDRIAASGLAATADGTIFTVDSQEVYIRKFAADGTFLAQVESGVFSSLIGMAMNANGMIVAGSRNGDIVVTDRALTTPFHFNVGSSAYVAIVPEPSSVVLGVLGIALLGLRLARRTERVAEPVM